MFTSVAFKSCVVQPLAAAVADAPVTVFGDEDEDDEDAPVPDVPDEEPVAADEEAAVPDAGTEDDDDDPAAEHPAAVATTAPTATAPPSLTINEAEPNMISRPVYERKVRFLALSTPL